MNDQNQYFTPRQLAEIKKQGEALGAGKIKEVENEWPALISQVKQFMAAGASPQDPAVQVLAKRWLELVNMFTGGNPAISESLGKMYQQEGPALRAGHGDAVPTPEMFEYIKKALL